MEQAETQFQNKWRKNRKGRILLLVFVLCSIGFVSNACRCRPPGCEERIECDRNGECRRVRVRRFFVERPVTTGYSENLSEYTGIVDLADLWQPESSEYTTMTVKFEDASGQFVQEDFSMHCSSAISETISEIDKDTKPYAFLLNNPTAVKNYSDEALRNGYTNGSMTVTFSIPITQVICSAPTGKYENHLRVKDFSGITYERAFVINYTAPTNSSNCNEGAIVITE